MDPGNKSNFINRVDSEVVMEITENENTIKHSTLGSFPPSLYPRMAGKKSVSDKENDDASAQQITGKVPLLSLKLKDPTRVILADLKRKQPEPSSSSAAPKLNNVASQIQSEPERANEDKENVVNGTLAKRICLPLPACTSITATVQASLMKFLQEHQSPPLLPTCNKNVSKTKVQNPSTKSAAVAVEKNARNGHDIVDVEKCQLFDHASGYVLSVCINTAANAASADLPIPDFRGIWDQMPSGNSEVRKDLYPCIKIESDIDVENSMNTLAAPNDLPTTESTALLTTESTALPTTESTALPTIESTALPTIESTALPTIESTALVSTKSTRVASDKDAKEYFLQMGFTEPFSRQQRVGHCKSPMFFLAGTWCRIDMLDWLFDNKLCTLGDLKKQFNKKRTLLYWVVGPHYCRNLKVVRWLYSKIGNASFGTNNDDKKSPLFKSCAYGNLQAAKFLILNADPSKEYIGSINSYTDFNTFLGSLRYLSKTNVRILRFWAILALETKPTGNRKKMLLWLKEHTLEKRQGRIDINSRNWRDELYVDPKDDPEDDANDFYAISSVDHIRNDETDEIDHDEIRNILREEQEDRDEETDPLMKLFLPPLGHRWVYKKYEEDDE